jgi:ABC-2 type transport system permease protein
VTPQSSPADALERPAPAIGGFSPTILRLEVRRLFRNRRTLILAILMPVFFELTFGRSKSYVHQSAGRGNLTAFEMISIALFGAVFATATGGAMVSVERALGWSRQLRVTPLSPVAYIVTKMLTSLCLAAGAVGAVYLIGAAASNASMPTDGWILTGICVWIGSLLFSALGLLIGYLLPAENVPQITSLVLLVCSLAGGLLIPVSQFSSHTLVTLAKFTPLYGLNELVHYPLIDSNFKSYWVLNLTAWLAVFVLGAVWRLRRDTARV